MSKAPGSAARPALSAMLILSLQSGGCTVIGGSVPPVDYAPTNGVSSEQFELLDVTVLELDGDETPERAAAQLKQRFGVLDAGADERTDVITDAGGGSSAVYTASGLSDDALQAEQYVAEFQNAPDGTLSVTALGRRWRCWRGSSENDGWTNRPCP